MNAVATAPSAAALQSPVIIDFEQARAAAAARNPDLFKTVSRERKQGGIKDIATGRSDEFRVALRDLYVQEGWNSRDLENPENIAHIAWLGENIAENGVLDALEVFFDGGKLKIVDGHMRYFGALRAIAVHGATVESVPVKTVPKGHGEIERLLAQEIRNSGKRLNQLERGILYGKLIDLGLTPKQIAQKVSRSEAYVNQLLALKAAPVAVKNLVASGQISATLAIEEVRRASSEAEAVERLTKGVEQAKADGKAKATRKSVVRATGGTGQTPKAALKVVGEVFKTAQVEEGEEETVIRLDSATYAKLQEVLAGL